MKIYIGDRSGKGNSLALFIFGIIYLAFCVVDLAASAQTGQKGADRSTAHITILAVTVFLLSYFLFHQKGVNSRRLIGSLSLLLIWTSIVNILRGIPTWTLLVQENMSLLWILSCVFFENIGLRKGSKPINRFAKFFLLFYIAATVYYFFDMYVRLGRIPVLNVVYCVIALLPWIFVNQSSNRKGELIIFSIVIAVTLLSMKRGAIIAIILMVLTYYFVQSVYQRDFKYFVRILIITILLVIAFVYADNLSGGFLSERFSREEMASGSGRMGQYTAIIMELKESDFFSILFGHGCQVSLDMFGSGIHNEWLSFLFNYGIIGLILYTIMVIGFFKQSRFIGARNPNLAVPCYMMSVFYFVLSMVSSGYGGYVGILIFGVRRHFKVGINYILFYHT